MSPPAASRRITHVIACQNKIDASEFLALPSGARIEQTLILQYSKIYAGSGRTYASKSIDDDVRAVLNARAAAHSEFRAVSSTQNVVGQDLGQDVTNPTSIRLSLSE